MTIKITEKHEIIISTQTFGTLRFPKQEAQELYDKLGEVLNEPAIQCTMIPTKWTHIPEVIYKENESTVDEDGDCLLCGKSQEDKENKE